MVLRLVGCWLLCLQAVVGVRVRGPATVAARNLTAPSAPAARSLLHQQHRVQEPYSTTHPGTFTLQGPPTCECESQNGWWKRPTRTSPKCLFIDIGAGDGRAFKKFLGGGYGPLHDCAYGTGAWEAILIEANPFFNNDLVALQNIHGNTTLKVLGSTSAWMCDGQETSYLENDLIGYALVTVPTTNVIRVMTENVISGDFVILNMDADKVAERAILPCLADSPVSKLLDRFYFVRNGPQNTMVRQATVRLATDGVDLPKQLSGVPLKEALEMVMHPQGQNQSHQMQV